MASTVVGLFEQRSEAEAALNDLVNSGFSRSDIDLKAPGGAGGDNSGLMRELEGEGVPSDDARLYVEGVKAGDALEIAHTSDDQAMMAQDIMNRHGALDIHDAFTQRGGTLTTGAAGVGAAGLAGAGMAAASATATAKTGAANVQGETVIPVVEEELAVGKRQIQRGGVRVFQRVEERPVSEQVTLHEEHVTVQRQAVDRPVTSADTAFKEGTIEMTETAEVPVVSKEARVVEEVVVGKTATDRTETVQDTVRRTDVEVEEIPGTTTTTGNKTTDRR
jgi:uncharacterized protein (TIGR02271 family)